MPTLSTCPYNHEIELRCDCGAARWLDPHMPDVQCEHCGRHYRVTKYVEPQTGRTYVGVQERIDGWLGCTAPERVS